MDGVDIPTLLREWLDQQVHRVGDVGRVARGDLFVKNWKLKQALLHGLQKFENATGFRATEQQIEKDYFRRLSLGKERGLY